MEPMEWTSLVLAFCVPIVIIGSLHNRYKAGRGIGWQFIRYNVIAISIPVAGLLALNNLLTGEAATIIGAAMGYAFGKSDDKSS